MIKLEKCPHCGSDVILCKLSGVLTAVQEFAIVCPDCGLETRMVVSPSANCCFDMGEAVSKIVERWNRRETNNDDVGRSL